jgi:hypothetical protein
MARSAAFALLLVAASLCCAQGESPCRAKQGVCCSIMAYWTVLHVVPALNWPALSLPAPLFLPVASSQPYLLPPAPAGATLAYTKAYSNFYSGVTWDTDATTCKQIIGERGRPHNARTRPCSSLFA